MIIGASISVKFFGMREIGYKVFHPNGISENAF